MSVQVNHNVIIKRFFKVHEDINEEVLTNHLEAEKNLEFVGNYYETIQSNKITIDMRRKLAQWMILLCDDLKVGYKTKQSAIILVDLVLSKMVVDKNYLQLLGITAIFIFIKCEESFQFSLNCAAYHCANAYTEENISLMETTILQVLKWKLHYSTPGEIARRLIYHFNSQLDLDLSKFFKSIDNYIDFCISENDLSDFSPNTIAVTAIILAFEDNLKLRDLFVKFIRGANIFDFDKVEYLYSTIIQQKNDYDPQVEQQTNLEEKYGCGPEEGSIQNANDETFDSSTQNPGSSEHVINNYENFNESQNQYVTPPMQQNKNAQYLTSLEKTEKIFRDVKEISGMDEERYY